MHDLPIKKRDRARRVQPQLLQRCLGPMLQIGLDACSNHGASCHAASRFSEYNLTYPN